MLDILIRKILIFKFKTISQKTNERALEMKQLKYEVFLRVASLRDLFVVLTGWQPAA